MRKAWRVGDGAVRTRRSGGPGERARSIVCAVGETAQRAEAEVETAMHHGGGVIGGEGVDV